MKINTFLKTLACLGSLQVAALAISITPTSGVLNNTRWQGPETSQSAIDIVLNSIVSGITGNELYKADSNPFAESGSLSGSYNTVFSNTTTDPEDATITYGSGNIVGATAYMLVKDGNQDPGWYFYNLTALGWNGTDTLSLTGFWPQQGAISHVALYGTSTPRIITPPGVPDGGTTLSLMGLALTGLAAGRRFLKK